MHSSPVSERASVTQEESPAFISEEVLQKYGLETLWYDKAPHDIDRGVHMTALDGDSLFVATAPRAGRTASRIVQFCL